MTRILDGTATAREIREEVAAGVAALEKAGGRRPGLAAVLVGDDPASQVYVRNKERAAAAAGFLGRVERLPAEIEVGDLIETVRRLNVDPEIDGILVQLPLPAGLDARPVIDAIAPEKDVDGLHPVNVGRLWLGRPGPTPATPTGIVELLRRSGIDLAGRHAVIAGRSDLVGKPLAGLLLRENCTVTVCHSRTRDLQETTRKADLFVAAIGRPAFFGPEHIRRGAVVVDVGINRITDPQEVERLYPGDEGRRETLARRGGVLVGDVDFVRTVDRAGAITPVPGGVGPLTIALLLQNTLEASRHAQALP